MLELHKGEGLLDYWGNGHAPDTFVVDGMGEMGSAEFGNFIAGFGAGHLLDPFALAAVRGFGSLYGLGIDFSPWELYFLGDDLSSVNHIHAGFGYGMADRLMRGKQGTHPLTCPP